MTTTAPTEADEILDALDLEHEAPCGTKGCDRTARWRAVWSMPCCGGRRVLLLCRDCMDELLAHHRAVDRAGAEVWVCAGCGSRPGPSSRWFATEPIR